MRTSSNPLMQLKENQMSNSEMTAFDPKAIQEEVASKVRGTVLDLLPDSQFQALVEKEWKAFFDEPSEKINITSHSGGFGSDQRYVVTASVSPFRNMVWGSMIQQFTPMMAKLTESEEWKCNIQRQWNDNKEELVVTTGELMQAKFEAHANSMAANMFGNMMAMAVEQMKQELNTVLANRGIY